MNHAVFAQGSSHRVGTPKTPQAWFCWFFKVDVLLVSRFDLIFFFLTMIFWWLWPSPRSKMSSCQGGIPSVVRARPLARSWLVGAAQKTRSQPWIGSGWTVWQSEFLGKTWTIWSNFGVKTHKFIQFQKSKSITKGLDEMSPTVLTSSLPYFVCSQLLWIPGFIPFPMFDQKSNTIDEANTKFGFVWQFDIGIGWLFNRYIFDIGSFDPKKVSRHSQEDQGRPVEVIPARRELMSSRIFFFRNHPEVTAKAWHSCWF